MNSDWRFVCAWCGKTWMVEDAKVKVYDVGGDRYRTRIVCTNCGKETVLEDVGVGGRGE